MSLTTFDGFIGSMPHLRVGYLKSTALAAGTVQGSFVSYWSTVGLPGAGSNNPGNITTGVVPTDSTAGALTLPVNLQAATTPVTSRPVSCLQIRRRVP